VGPDPDSMGSLDPYPDPDPGGQKLPTNKWNKSAGCSLLRPEGFSCSLDISKLQFLIKNRRKKFSTLFCFNESGTTALKKGGLSFLSVCTLDEWLEPLPKLQHPQTCWNLRVAIKHHSLRPNSLIQKNH
jgi:hypothetical protein